MTCREFIEFLMDFDEGRLPAEVHTRFEAHLAECPDCVNYLASYRAAVALGQLALADEDGAPTDDAPAELLQAILALRDVVHRERQ